MDLAKVIRSATLTLVPSTLICLLLSGCQTAATKWVDISGSNRGPNQFQMDKASCSQLAYSSGSQAEDSNSCYTKTCGLLRILVAESSAASSFDDCMTSNGWKLETQALASNLPPEEPEVWQSTGHTKRYGWFLIHPVIWKEELAGQNGADRVSVVGNKVYLGLDGWIRAKIALNYDRPYHFDSISSPVLSAEMTLKFGCQLSNGRLLFAEYFSMSDDKGTPLKSVTTNRIFPMNGDNDLGQMRKYICAQIGY
ncbi:hypothetical protein [Metallibacterium sp.]|uniref:hypothetical protein n=2 Tax=Metallibacterium sp. TaxID=2940281 RepID=UPI00261C52AD|nr:hypothetical protein [Metallibacterium sp.]